MIIHVTAKPNAKRPRLEKIDESHLLVAVKEAPREGRANRAIIKALAAHFAIPRSRIHLLSGARAKHKTFSVE